MQNISICLLSSSRVLTLCRASMKQGAWEVAVPTLFVWGKSNVHIKPYCTRLYMCIQFTKRKKNGNAKTGYIEYRAELLTLEHRQKKS